MIKAKKASFYSFITGGRGFALKHDGWAGCGIPDAGDTIVLTGGDGHNFVTRWVDQNLFISYLLLYLAFMFVRRIFCPNCPIVQSFLTPRLGRHP